MTRSALIRLLSGATLGAALAAAPAAFAHDHESKDDKANTAKQASVMGTVEAIGPGSITLKEHNGRMLKVELDKETTFDNAGKTGSVSELRAGMVVTVRGEKQKDGTVQADSVRYGQPS